MGTVSDTQADKTMRIVIRGRVQGVGFRAWVHHQAELHGLAGWVRNRDDGTVEAVFAGPADLVDVMLKACGQGPRGAQVEAAEVETAGSADMARVEPGSFVIFSTD
jgi:acylphosphatase